MEEHLRGLGYIEWRDDGNGVSFVTERAHGPVLRSLEMDAAVWTAIGLLTATSLGALFYLGARIDGLGARIDSLAARMDARFDGMESRFDALSARLDTHLDRHAG